jgi:tetratricopeptide (TPR) repeat protein
LAEKPDDALEDLELSLQFQPQWRSHAETLALLGDIHFARFELAPVGFADRGDTDLALKCYEQLLELQPDYPNLGWVLYQKARILIACDQANDAVAALKMALTLPHQMPVVPAFCYERLGFVELFERHSPETALEYFAQAASQYPGGAKTDWLVQLHLLRNRAYREQKQYVNALVAAHEALDAIDSKAASYRRSLAEIALGFGETLARITGREEDAIHYLVQFLSITGRPLGVDVTWSRVQEAIGDLSFRLRRFWQAAASYEDALVLNPYQPLVGTLPYKTARSYYRVGAYERTIVIIQNLARSLDADGEMMNDYRLWSVLGDAHFARAEFREAAAAYQRALAIAPAEAPRRELIASCLQLCEQAG